VAKNPLRPENYTGWHHALIPDSYLIAEFFQKEADAIEELEATIAEAQSELAEAVETAQEVVAYELEEDETVTASTIKAELKKLIDDFKGSQSESAKKELNKFEAQEDAITTIEKRIRSAKAELKTLTDELEHKLKLKRLGAGEFKAESELLLKGVNEKLATLDDSKKDDKKKIPALKKDKAALERRLAKTDALLTSIGGQLTGEHAKTLILKKLFDVADQTLSRYLNAEKRRLVHANDNLWDKYAICHQSLESSCSATVKTVDGLLQGLGYY
jgi:type I restriction enzyme M protein